MYLIALRKGGVKCSPACPFYEEKNVIHAINGQIKARCRMIMNPFFADCDMFNPCQIETLEVSEHQWRSMQHAVKKHATLIQKTVENKENE